MNNLFLILFLLSALAIVIGLINPKWLGLQSRLKALGITFVASLIFLIAFGYTIPESEKTTEQEKSEEIKQEEERQEEAEVKKKEEKEKAETEEKKKKEEEPSQDEIIKKKITELAEDESMIKINKIDVVENFADDSNGGYNGLVHLIFDVKNRPETAKGGINAITDKLGSKLGGTDGLENVTFFWEVPYLLEGTNIVKINAEQEDGKMYRVDEWFDGRIFD